MMFNRRPLLITPWSMWIKPRLKVRYIDIRFHKKHGTDDFLEYITAGDKNLVEYLQAVAGMAAFGKVFNENVIFAYGTGGNGKSTLFNALQGVFGTYATTIRPEILMAMKNQSEVSGLAALKGKRYVLAAETEEGSRLSSSTMKRMSSTDTINARVLYHEAFDFKPSHTLVLCTNHLPKVGSTEWGTWRNTICRRFKPLHGQGCLSVLSPYKARVPPSNGLAGLWWFCQ